MTWLQVWAQKSYLKLPSSFRSTGPREEMMFCVVLPPWGLCSISGLQAAETGNRIPSSSTPALLMWASFAKCSPDSGSQGVACVSSFLMSPEVISVLLVHGLHIDGEGLEAWSHFGDLHGSSETQGPNSDPGSASEMENGPVQL